MKTIIALAAALALSACAAPAIDWSATDKTCSARCSDGYNQCSSKFTLTPLLTAAGCNESLKVCASSCGASIVSK